MKKLLFNEAYTLATTQQLIVPANSKLWERTNSLFELQDHAYLIQYYESLGGRWRIKDAPLNEKFGEKPKPVVRFKDPLPNKVKEQPVAAPVVKAPVAKPAPIDEEIEEGAYGLKNDEKSKSWMKRMKEHRPSLYNKIKDWD